MYKKLFASLLLCTTAFSFSQKTEFQAFNSDAGLTFVNKNEFSSKPKNIQNYLRTTMFSAVGLLESDLTIKDESPLIKKNLNSINKTERDKSLPCCTPFKKCGSFVRLGVKQINKSRFAKSVFIAFMMYKFLL